MSNAARKHHSIEMNGIDIVVVPFSVAFDDKTEFRLALNVHKVVKVFDLEDYDPLPASYGPFFGLVKIDDMSVPVFDLKEVLHSDGIDKIVTPSKSFCGRVIICAFQSLSLGF